jgi:hypothetical protein
MTSVLLDDWLPEANGGCLSVHGGGVASPVVSVAVGVVVGDWTTSNRERSSS